MKFLLFATILGGMTIFHRYYQKDSVEEIIKKNEIKFQNILDEMNKKYKKTV